MTHRENLLRCYRFERPAWIPISSGLPTLLWESYDPDDLEDLLVSHEILFPGYEPGSVTGEETRPDLVKGAAYTDGWGCVWETLYNGMVGQVTRGSLENWDSWTDFAPPDSEHTDGMYVLDWDTLATSSAKAKSDGMPVRFHLPHGHTFNRLCDLRGYENALVDMALGEERFEELVAVVRQFNVELLRRYVGLGPDVMGIPEDLGIQDRLAISPALFRRYIKPIYRTMIQVIHDAAGDAGNKILAHEHSDGYIMEIVDDLLEIGVDVINLQDLVNGIGEIAMTVKGRAAIDLDLDRQSITAFGSPADIDAHVRECVVKLGSEDGGLSLTYSPWPPTRIENIRAVFDSMERHCTAGA